MYAYVLYVVSRSPLHPISHTPNPPRKPCKKRSRSCGTRNQFKTHLAAGGNLRRILGPVREQHTRTHNINTHVFHRKVDRSQACERAEQHPKWDVHHILNKKKHRISDCAPGREDAQSNARQPTQECVSLPPDGRVLCGVTVFII